MYLCYIIFPLYLYLFYWIIIILTTKTFEYWIKWAQEKKSKFLLVELGFIQSMFHGMLIDPEGNQVGLKLEYYRCCCLGACIFIIFSIFACTPFYQPTSSNLFLSIINYCTLLHNVYHPAVSNDTCNKQKQFIDR